MRTLLALALSGALASVASAGPVTLKTRAPVAAIAADGKGVVLISSNRPGVRLWSPTQHRVVAFRSVLAGGDCNCSMNGVALAGRRVAWLESVWGMTATETIVGMATLARPRPVGVAYASGASEGHYGSAALAPVGDGRLLVFTVEQRCAGEGEDGPPCPTGRKPHDVIAATIWRVPGRSRCPADSAVRRCARVAKADGELTVLAVDTGRIVARTDDGVSLLTPTGLHIRDFPVAKVRAGELSGNRLALRVPGAVEVYDTRSGQLIRRLEVASSLRLEDFDRGMLVLAAGRTVTLRRLSDGRTATIRARGVAHAQLEPSGLFVAGGRRVTFTPMADVLRRLAAGTRLR
jgi:hypothetical protein